MSVRTDFKKLYEYIDGGNSCKINTPELPRHWYNYLWNEDRYCSQISEMGHGRSYYLSEKADMCMINRDDARYVFLRDDDLNESWNIGQGPLNTKVDDYSCVHSIGYSKISSMYKNVKGSIKFFVPEKGFNEVWTIELENTGDKEKNISVFSAVSFSLEGFSYPRYYEMYRCCHTMFDEKLNGVYCKSSHPFAPHKRYNGFISSTEKVFAYDGDLSMFCGTSSTVTELDSSATALFQRPRILIEGLDCTNSNAALFILGGVLQHKIKLAPNEKKQITIIFGISESIEEAREVTARFKGEKSQNRMTEKYSNLSLETPDKKINSIMNNWVKKQVDFCIVGKKGVRDNLQIAVVLLNYRQEKAREEILECLRHQFSDGHAVLTWYPYDDTRYSDQPFWIIWAVCELVKETGDFSILDEVISWQDGGEATVLEHVKAAVKRLILDKGKNGLVKIYFADWNDALNITTDENAESVMLSHQFCLALRELESLMRHTRNIEYADFLKNEFERLKADINKNAWDGKWYMRVLSDVENIGSEKSNGSKIYINAQSWAVLAGIVPDDRLSVLVQSVDSMEHDFGFPLNMPPYSSYSPNVGRMSGMLPGLFENGGVYCHATGFKILMDCKIGRGEKALETLKKIMPDSEKNPSSQSGAEPYVFTNCYSTNPDYYGKSYQSWTTGTSAWCLMGLYEGILGVKRDYNGLKIEPCFPASWSEAKVTRCFRGAYYNIIIKNRAAAETASVLNGIGESRLRITVDGTQLSSNILPDFRDNKTHKVEVEICQ